MTDAEREAQIRLDHGNPGHSDPGLPCDQKFLLRLLDEARAEIQKRHEVIEEQGLSMGNMTRELREKDAEIARLREPSSHANSVGEPAGAA